MADDVTVLPEITVYWNRSFGGNSPNGLPGNAADAGGPTHGGGYSGSGDVAGLIHPSAQQLGLDQPPPQTWHPFASWYKQAVDQSQHLGLTHLAMTDDMEGANGRGRNQLPVPRAEQQVFHGFNEVFPIRTPLNVHRGWGGRLDLFQFYGGTDGTAAEAMYWHAMNSINAFEYGLDPGMPDTGYGAPVYYPVFPTEEAMFNNTPVGYQLFLPWALSFGPRVYYDSDMPSLDETLFGPAQGWLPGLPKPLSDHFE